MSTIFPPVASRTRVARKSSTTASGSTSHIIDTGLGTFAADYWNGNLVAMRSGSAKGATRTITDFDGTKILTVSPALPASPGTSELYEIFTDQGDTVAQCDIGDASADGTTIFDSIKYLYQQTSGASMASVATDSVIAHILAIAGDVSDYDDTLHSLEAIYNAVSGGVPAIDRLAGKSQIFEKSITAAANAGTTTIATITTQPCLIESVVLHSDTLQTPALTSAAIQGGENGVLTFIDSTDAAATNINAVDEQVSWTGASRLVATKTIIMDLVGTGATAVDFTVIVGYRSCSDGGYLV